MFVSRPAYGVAPMQLLQGAVDVTFQISNRNRARSAFGPSADTAPVQQ
jgi:hypothetical protein